jgi:hypothetical protein
MKERRTRERKNPSHIYDRKERRTKERKNSSHIYDRKGKILGR